MVYPWANVRLEKTQKQGPSLVEERPILGADGVMLSNDVMSEPKVGNRAEVAGRIREWIEKGQLTLGGAIPAERELCRMLGVQRMTVRGALAVLEQEGVISRIGLRSRIVAGQRRTMEHSIVIINSAKYQLLVGLMHMPGWAVMMSVAAISEVSGSGRNLVLIHPERISHSELERIVDGRPAGVVFPEPLSELRDRNHWLERLHSAGIPVSVYGESEELTRYDRVCSDHEIGSYELTKHMIGLGCHRPLMFYLVGTEPSWVAARRKGYERALREAGLQPLPFARVPSAPGLAVPDGPEQFEAARRHAVAHLVDFIGPACGQKRPDALLLATDGDLYPVASACRSLGLRPNEDILLAGYDNYWVECWERKHEQVSPVVTVDKRNVEAGRMLVRLVCERAEGKLPREPQMRMIEPELIITAK